jgi:8-oxo-dGTP pyrophosphatase MutT (NUDIX family)
MSGARREALLEALDAYSGGAPRDEEAVARFRTFLERDDPFRRADPDGHVTASAVVTHTGNVAGTGLGLHPAPHFRFLLVFHRKLDRWLQPGGHVEDGDASVFDAALREACEETGLADFSAPLGAAILDLDVHAIPASGADPPHFHYDVRFLLTTGNGGGISADAAWFRMDAIPRLDSDGSLSRAVHKAVQRMSAP